MNNNGFIVILAYPDVVVRIANGEVISKLWPLFGIGGRNRVMAGHAALLLVSKENNSVRYFDFGRYITSNTFGRVRSEETDNEVHIPFKAQHNDVEILNLEEIVLYLDKHPEKTHGEGRLVVGVNHEVDYDKALHYLLALQSRVEVPYGAFKKDASNCARLVTDVLIHSCTNRKTVKRLKRSYTITPSPISNVINGTSKKQTPISVQNQQVEKYRNTSILREYRRGLFAKVSQELCDIGTIEPDLRKFSCSKSQWLGGIGSGAWFEIRKSDRLQHYTIIRRNAEGVIDMDAEFILSQEGLCLDKPFQFKYGSTCKTCYIEQDNKLYVLERINN